MKPDITSIEEVGESAGLAEPLLETPDGEVYKLGILVAQARNGDRKAGSVLKEMGITVETAQAPHFSASVYVQEKLLSEMGRDDYELGQGARRTVAQMRSDLCGVDSSVEEQLIAQAIISDWILLTYLTNGYQLGLGASSVREDDLWQKRINHVHRRYTRSITTMAQVKKLQRGNSVQVNIADKQIVKNS